MKKYEPKKIEPKWQKYWKLKKTYKTSRSKGKDTCYVLDMFPYPSGEGLHVGHPKGYIATDIYSRFKKMQGFDVLHPMGWDAFGLPAENYAIKHKINPNVSVKRNVKNFKDQLSILGFNYDWDREINTSDPKFYKWTQWIFLQMYKKGLAFQSFEPINWCPSCKTGLANEDLDEGKCEVCGTVVEKKPLRQWVLRITDYAERMLADLKLLNEWPDSIKLQQENWIGKKEGIVVPHKVVGSSLTIDTFSAYPAWMFADTYIVLAPEHPLVIKLVEGQPEANDVMKFVNEMSKMSFVERTESKEKLGVFTGKYADDPFTKGSKMPIWVANFALMDFGTGAIRCSAHDERDVEFAQKYGIKLRHVVGNGKTFVNAHDNEGVLSNSDLFSGRSISPELIKEMVDWMEENDIAKRKVTYKLRDWVFSRQRYWGEPIPLIHCDKCGVVPVPENDLPVKLPNVKNYEPTGTGESPLAAIDKWVNVKCPRCKGKAKRETNTMPQWAGSCWYYLRFIDPKNRKAPIDKKLEKSWMPVSLYVGGAEHATRHLIYARFWHKFLYDIGAVSTLEPFTRLHSVGLIAAEDGRKMSKRWGNVINPNDVVKTFGADSLRVYEMFMGPFGQGIAWSTNNILGARRFLERVWAMQEYITKDEPKDVTVATHRMIKKVTEDVEGFAFNTAISAMMIFVNVVYAYKSISTSSYKSLLIMLSAFAPHMSEELWRVIGEKRSVYSAKWPFFDKDMLLSEHVIIAVQINGKTRTEIQTAKDAGDREVEQIALENEKVKFYVQGRSVIRVIVVKNRLINIVIS